MSSKQLMRLTLVLVAGVVLWGALALGRHVTQDQRQMLALPAIDTASVDSFTLTGPREGTVLKRAAANAWTVNGRPAATSSVSELFKGLTDTARMRELVATSRTSHAQLGVDSASAQRLRAYSHGRVLVDLTVGRQPSTGEMFIRKTDAAETYILHGMLALTLARNPDDWRDKRIASVLPESVATIDIGRAKDRYTVRRAERGWTLSSGAAADSTAIQTMLGFYRALNASGFATQAQADSAHFTQSPRHIRLLGKSGNTLLSLVIDSTAAGIWARPDSGDPVYKIEGFLLAQIAPAENMLKAKKSP